MIINKFLSTALLLAIAASPSAHATPTCDEPFTEVLRVSVSGIFFEQLRVLDNEAEWCAFWTEAYSNSSSPPPCDATVIDFDTEVAIVAAIGGRSNSCFAVDIACVGRAGNSENIRVEVVEQQPSLSCVCLPVVVSPLQVVKIVRPVHRANFKKRIELRDCSGRSVRGR